MRGPDAQSQVRIGQPAWPAVKYESSFLGTNRLATPDWWRTIARDDRPLRILGRIGGSRTVLYSLTIGPGRVEREIRTWRRR